VLDALNVFVLIQNYNSIKQEQHPYLVVEKKGDLEMEESHLYSLD
jgi:hypothetical protein